MEFLNTDILVVGGGGAGSRAALSAKKMSPKLEIISREAVPRINDLMDLGIKFDCSNGSRPKQKKLSGCSKARSLSIDGKTGIEIVSVLKNENYKKGVRVIENCRLVELVVDGNKVCGGVFIAGGKPVLINARAVVLATGGAGGIFHLNVNPDGTYGDGYSAALKAGASVINMEFIQIGPGVVHPALKFIIHSYMWEFLPRLLNAKNEEFLPKYIPDNLKTADVLSAKRFSFPFSCRTIAKYLDIAMFKEIVGGNATKNGGIFLDISRVPAEELISKASVTYNIFKETGFDISKQMVEIAPLVQSFNGGVIIDENGGTEVSGLFAAGEVSGGIHGADRPGGNNLIDCQVFGHRAGTAAAGYACNKRTSCRAVNLKAREIEKRMYPDKNVDKNKTSIGDLKKLFSRYLSIVRTNDGIDNVLMATEEILWKGADGSVAKTSSVYNTALIGSAIAKSVKLRKESRGSHYREDFPCESSNFGKRIIASLKEGEIFTKFEGA
jgi:succinate dehydrogenase/fumarate reductase flavoprotein subunit